MQIKLHIRGDKRAPTRSIGSKEDKIEAYLTRKGLQFFEADKLEVKPLQYYKLLKLEPNAYSVSGSPYILTFKSEHNAYLTTEHLPIEEEEEETKNPISESKHRKKIEKAKKLKNGGY